VCGGGSPQAVAAAAEKVEGAEVTQDLQLLTDFGADVAVGHRIAQLGSRWELKKELRRKQ